MRLKVERENETDNNLIKIGIVILLLISFFISFRGINYIYLALQVIAILCILISEKKISRYQQLMPATALLCIVIIIGNRNARLLHGSFFTDFRICTALLFYIFLYERTNWYDTLIKWLIILGIFYGVSTLYLHLFPDAYYHYVVPLFGDGSVSLVKRGYAAGFSMHYSTTAIYHAVTLGIPACVFVRKDCLESKHRVFFILLSILIYTGVLLTGKRAHSIIIPICIVFCYYFFSPDKKISTKAKTIGGILLFLGILYICIQLVPSLNNVLIRFQSKIDNEDIISGRDKLLQDCLYLFSDNPIIGSGWGSFMYYTHLGVENAHNVYAQLIAENGILSIPFFTFIFGNIWHTGKAVVMIAKENIKLDRSTLICMNYSFYIQIFFALYCFTGNPLYDFQFVFPYMIGCAIGENAYNAFVICDRTLEKSKSWKYIKVI